MEHPVRALLGLAVFLAAMALVIGRPRGLNEAWPAVGGAGGLAALGLLTPADLLAVARETGGVLLFLLGMMVVSAALELAGVFAWAASYAARASGRSRRRLLVNVFVLGAAVTAALSLDVTVIIVTPLVYATVTALGVDPLPYLYACTFVANTGSLVFPMSNLTNLLVTDRLGLPFWRFTLAMALPNAAAVAMNVAVFAWIFRGHLAGSLPAAPPEAAPARTPFFRGAAAVLALALLGLFAAGLAGRPLWPVALSAAAATAGVAAATGGASLPALARGISWSLFPFVWGMGAIVRGIEHAGLTAGFARIVLSGHASPAARLVTAGGIAAAGANVFNNIPMTLLMLGILPLAPRGGVMALAAATLIGVNIGPALTTAGSLATILWLAAVRRRGVEVPALEYLRIGAVTVPLVLAAALAALVLEGGLR